MRQQIIDRFVHHSDLAANRTLVLSSAEARLWLDEQTDERSFLDIPSYDRHQRPGPIPQEGIDLAVVQADMGIAASGTVAVQSSDEQLRLATCLAEHLVVVLNADHIVAELADTAEYLRQHTSSDCAFLAYITGPSRTADIERVLTIGVHGPARMSVLVIDDKEHTA